MTTFDVAPLRIGSVTAEQLSNDSIPLYSRLVTVVTGEPSEFIGNAGGAVRAVTAEVTTRKPSSLFALTLESLLAVRTADLALLDLSAPSLTQTRPDLVRGANYIHIARALVAALNDPAFNATRILVILPELPPEGDALLHLLQPELSDGRLYVIGRDGRSAKGTPTDATTFRDELAELQRDPLELLELKLTARRGWFPKPAHPIPEYVRNFYEGYGAQAELHALFVDYLHRQTPTSDVVLFVATESRWIESPLRSACGDLGIECKEFHHPGPGSEQSTRTLIVMPMIDRGDLARDVAQAFETPPRLLAVLSSAAAPQRRRVLTEAGRTLKVDYLLHVPQERVSAKDPACDPTRVGVPESSRAPDTAVQLTPYEFWDLVRDCGLLESEQNVPTFRSSSGRVPNFAVMLTRYGPWLAHKLWNALEHRSLVKLPTDTLFIRPEGEAASERLGDLIEFGLGARVLAIPRSLLDRVANMSATEVRDHLDDLVANQGAWVGEMRTAATRSAVALDEFVVSGKSCLAIARLAAAFDISVHSVACIADLAPTERDKFPLEVTALYAWQHGVVAA